MKFEIVFMICHALAETLTQVAYEKIPERIGQLRISGIRQLDRQLRLYHDKYNMPDKLLENICETKLKYILSATSKTTISSIFEAKKPRYNSTQNNIIDNDYQVDGEELFAWSLASEKAPLDNTACERAMLLFQRIYGVTLDQYLEKNKNGGKGCA